MIENSPNSWLYIFFSWLLIRWDQWAVNEWIIKLQPSSTFPKFVSEQTWSVNLERKIKSKFMVKKFQLNSLERFFLNLNLTRKFPWLYGWIFVYKVHIFCLKILRNLHLTFVCMYCRQKYSRVRNKHSRTLINFLTFFQGLRPYSGLHSIR